MFLKHSFKDDVESKSDAAAESSAVCWLQVELNHFDFDVNLLLLL